MKAFIQKHPVIAILRHITPNTAAVIAQCLYENGVRVIEVPLNSPQAIASIANIVNALPKDCLVGAGTVVSITQAKQVQCAGGQLIISPHCDINIIEYCQSENLHVVPGIATPTEAFIAYQAGARWLKLFPAQTYGYGHLKALKSVLPHDVHIIAVGGISETNSSQWLSSGASALGIGNDLFQENNSLAVVTYNIKRLNQVLSLQPLNSKN